MFSLVFLTTISTLVIIAIGESVARAFALAGALSIIRFRTPIKDSKDLTFIFFGLIGGLSAGTGNLIMALVSTIAISIAIIIYHKTAYSASFSNKFLLRMTTTDFDLAEKAIEALRTQSGITADLTNVSHRPESGKTEIVYTTKFSKQHDPQSVIGALRQNEAITDLNLVPLSDMVNY